MKALIPASFIAIAMLSSCGGSEPPPDPPVGLVETEHDDSTITEVEVYDNVQHHPDLVRICVEGTAWITIDRNFDGPHAIRAAELDKTCPKGL